MRTKDKNKIRLTNVLFILDLDVSLLLDKRIYYKDLREYFDKNSI